MAGFLDLLGTILSPALTASETARVRTLLAGQSRPSAPERPWVSGVPDLTAAGTAPPLSEVEELRLRVMWLELSLKVVCDLVTEAGLIDREALAARLRDIEHKLADAREEAEKVTCVECGRRIQPEEAYRRVTGILCVTCHTGGRVPAAETEGPLETASGYRDAAQPKAAGEREDLVVCGYCQESVARRASYNTANGPACARCFQAREEA